MVGRLAVIAAGSSMGELPAILEAIFRYLSFHPEAVVAAAGIYVGLRRYRRVSTQNQTLQRRENYLRLECESIEVFRFCSEHPDVPRYLDGVGSESDEGLKEAARWFVCQTLNLFEIIVSFRRDEMVSREIFATWIPWFYELGTSTRFRDYWKELGFHYSPDVSAILDKAIECPPLQRLLETGDLAPLEEFNRHVADVMSDRRLLRYLENSHKQFRIRTA